MCDLTQKVKDDKLTQPIEEIQVDLLVMQKLVEEHDYRNRKIIKEIVFSKQECKLKKLYYDAFDKIPKSEPKNGMEYLSGIQIIEDDNIPPNIMVLRYNNRNFNQTCIYKDGSIYKVPNLCDIWKNVTQFSA